MAQRGEMLDRVVEDAIAGILDLMPPTPGHESRARRNLLSMERAALLELHAGLAAEMARTAREATESWERYVALGRTAGPHMAAG